MSRKRTKIVKELDPQEVAGLSQARIDHYLSLGYKPYLDEHSHVKWLTQAQRAMRDAVVSHRHIRLHRPPRPQHRKKRRSWRRDSFKQFIRAYWPFLLLIAVLIVGTGLLLIKPNIFF
ncbi:MAG: hypothetical protein PHH74_01820 [Candidatus Cloacimonetes bacterium]|nr:hypothetical protein [Candidatus Cloacimonadota bacterium]